MFFSGEYERTLDAKNRVALPPKLKDCLTDGTVMLFSRPKEPFIRAYRVDEWEEMINGHYFKDDGIDRSVLQRQIGKNSERSEIDGQGRFTISPKFCERIEIKKDIIMIGVGKRFEIWSKEVYLADNDDDSSILDELVFPY
ncbi:MAG: hypothetical protein PUB20_06830 [Clostridia bacterium]|nr:hypothetical protein [Clostridia bacterium]